MYFKKRDYYSFESPEEIKNRAKELSKIGLFSGNNLSVRTTNEDRFIITQKFSISIFSISPSPALIEMTVIEGTVRTKLKTIIRADYRVFVIQLLLIGMFLYGCSFLQTDILKATATIIVSIILIVFIHFYFLMAMNRIQKQFKSSFDLI